MNAPVLLFAYKRPAELQTTIDALKANHLAPESDLFIFVDAPGKAEDRSKVDAVRRMLDRLTGFKSIHRDYADANIGCADSIIRGVSLVLAKYPSAIILEDDLITAPNFLNFMNQGLREHVDNRQVYSVAGYTFPFKRPADYPLDAYVIPRHNPWGWATWADRWASIDWDLTDYADFERDKERQKAFNQGGSDLAAMLRSQVEGRIDAWDIRFGYNQFKAGGLTVYPTVSKVENIGFGKEATHTDIYNRYKTQLDDGVQQTFNFPTVTQPTPYYHRKTLQRYSVPVRIYNRLKTLSGMR